MQATTLGEMMQVAQSPVGNVLSSRAMLPPMVGLSSTRYTKKPGGGKVERRLNAGDAAPAHEHGAAELFLSWCSERRFHVRSAIMLLSNLFFFNVLFFHQAPSGMTLR